MALARFFDRVFAAAGRALTISRATLERELASKVVVVHCGSGCNDGGNDQWTAELTVNLLARLYPTILIRGESRTTERMVALAKRINPAIAHEAHADVLPAANVVIGGGVEGVNDGIFVRADGWVARMSLSPFGESQRGPRNSFAAAAAACLGCSEVFRRVFSKHIAERPPRELNLSLLDFGDSEGEREELAELDVGEVAFVGLGAVANAAIWALSRCFTVRGSVALVEPQDIELSNLQRYVLTTDEDEGGSKLDLVLAALKGTGLVCSPFREKLDAYADRFPESFARPTVCVSVDNIPDRRFVQALLPRLVINGCTDEFGFASSWHVFDGPEGCLCCAYQPTRELPNLTDMVAEAFGLEKSLATRLYMSRQPPSAAEFDGIAKHLDLDDGDRARWRGKPLHELYTNLVCGSVKLNLKSVSRVEAVPLAHQSAFAGVLMAAELVKRTSASLASRSQPHAVVQVVDVLGPLPPAGYWARGLAHHPRCICQDPAYQRGFARKWRGGTTSPG